MDKNQKRPCKRLDRRLTPEERRLQMVMRRQEQRARFPGQFYSPSQNGPARVSHRYG